MSRLFGLVVLVLGCLITTGAAFAEAPLPLPTPVGAGPAGAATASVLQPQDGRLQILFQGQNFSIPVQVRDGRVYAAARGPELAGFLDRVGATASWSGDPATLTIYGARHYLRWRVDDPSGVVDGSEVQRPGVLVTAAGGPLLAVRALADFLDLRLEAGGADGTVACWPVIEKAELVNDGGDRKIVLRATAPFDYDSSSAGTALRLTVRDARWGAASRDLDLDDAHLHVDGTGTASDPIVVSIQMPAQWKGETGSRLLLTEADITLTPDFRLAPQYHLQTLSDLQAYHSAGEMTVALDASGPVQYFWRYNPDRHTLVIDVPQTEWSGSDAVDVTGPEIQSVQVRKMQTAAFPFVRVELQLNSHFGFEVRCARYGSCARLTMQVAPDSMLPVASTTGGGYEPPGLNHAYGVIVLDPGHGGADPGAINRWTGLREKDVALDICERLRTLLAQDGWTVYMTRDCDRDVTWAHSPDDLELGARANVANRHGADFFVSVHCNSSVSSALHGTTYHWYKWQDRDLAGDLSGALSADGLTNLGPRRNDFYVLSHTRCPAVLIETGFISNPGDEARLADPQEREHIAESLAQALCAHCLKKAALNGQVPTGR